MEHASFVSTATVKGALVARIECNSVGQRESAILQEALVEAAENGHWRLAVDMTNVTILTSVGIGMLITLHKKCHEHKGKFVIFGISPEIVDLLRLTRLDKLLKIAKDRDAAVKAVA
ncbi:MAG: anti-sigma factor antagonist [Phycisphaerales bacterium]|nr:MAG: anti-sigma factor antagonist [Phycisphaerales bacterium]